MSRPRFAATGAQGFLGWHMKAALQEQGIEVDAIPVGDKFDLAQAKGAINGSARAIHIAGVNRATDTEVESGNLAFAEQFAAALRAVDAPPPVVVFANSTQAGNGTVYGESKANAAEIIGRAAHDVGADFVDVLLPNLFGEHGRPFYNSVTATFCHLISAGGSPTVEDDKALTLLHAQNAADLLTGFAPASSLESLQRNETVSSLLRRILGLAELYRSGEIPNVANEFDRDLFNTYRSYGFPNDAPIHLTRHADERGSFFEIIRAHGGPGQSSFSTTAPQIVRGNHYHRRKIERFAVLQGSGRISLRRLFTNKVVSFDVSGEEPSAVDMPTMWTHNIENIGEAELYTSFWTNDIFDPKYPDTIAEVV